jgi:hypothetical protein
LLDLTGTMLQGPSQPEGTHGLFTQLLDHHKSSNLMAILDDDEIRARYNRQYQQACLQHVAMTGYTLCFNGPIAALALQRLQGTECRTPVCATVWARAQYMLGFPMQQNVAGHDSKLQSRLARKLAELVTTATGITPSTESTAPFVGIADNRRMDSVCDPDSLPVSALTKPLFDKSLMIDLSTVTVRSAAHRQLAAHDVA